jgi:hypothetical protein
MILDDPDDAGSPERDLPDSIAAGALLAACAIEAARQAQAFGTLDRSLGQAVGLLRAAMAGNPEVDPAGLSALIRDLQMADGLRQDSEGLARAIALVSGSSALTDRVSAEDLRACTVVHAL